MLDVRRDVAEAAARMHVTFGTRAAIRNLDDVLEDGEVVREMVAATYAAGDGLLVLTDRRAIAVRDDYSMYRVQHVALADTYAVDYAPKVHDGLGVLTPTGRVAVRKMDRRDSDRFVDALLAANPHVAVGCSRPGAKGAPLPQTAPSPARGASAPPPDPAPAGPAAGRSAGYDTSAAPSAPPAAKPAGPTPQSDATAATAQAADTEMLVAVLADLHAKGVLTTDELASKIAQITAESRG